MGFAEWVMEFKQLHEKARQKALTADERILYESARDDLASVVICFQTLELQEGVQRNALRVACEFLVDLDLPDGPGQGHTEDLSVGGFALHVSAPVPATGIFPFTMHLPHGPISGTARVVSVTANPQGQRVAFAFETMDEADREQLELTVFDAALSRFKS